MRVAVKRHQDSPNTTTTRREGVAVQADKRHSARQGQSK